MLTLAMPDFDDRETVRDAESEGQGALNAGRQAVCVGEDAQRE